ncbi:MAG: adenylosuccinate synthase [Phycisphaerae bacterium]|nr:adenylosuccinate synthase [Phycisphaerae bacterium]
MPTPPNDHSLNPSPFAQSGGHTAIVGLQWGDEGKGKLVDLLAPDHDCIVRYNGGANAGHTVVVGDERYALHLVPSGILFPGCTCIIGNGVVVDPAKLLEEIDGLRARGIEIDANLRLSSRAHVVMPYHKALDGALEEFMAGNRRDAIGTTRRGIGPAYADKVFRSTAIRVGDLAHEDRLRTKLELTCELREAQLRSLGAADPESVDVSRLLDQALAQGERLAPHVTDTTWYLHDALADGRSILFEGANACLLDVDHGTYPFVTSSNCSTLGIPAGTGVPLGRIDRVLGIMKAYSTRVGGGPFPTELDDAIGEQIRERGREFGTTTGRPRRCGWLDLVAVKYTAMVCGVTGIACTLFDVLGGLDEVRLCVGYRRPDGTVTDRFPPDALDLAEIEPVYETMSGWPDPMTPPNDREDLPDAARRYLDRIESFVGVPIQIVSIGPERREVLVAG